MSDAGSSDDEDFDFKEVAAPSDGDEAVDEESLSSALKLLSGPSAAEVAEEQAEQAAAAAAAAAPRDANGRLEVLDDFVRNFLREAGLSSTLEQFETEWYERAAAGTLTLQGFSPVPDMYVRSQELEAAIKALRAELAAVRAAAIVATGNWEQLRKERDFHRLHHKRTAQEKEKLLADVKCLRAHYAQYEPTIKELRAKYEAATRDATRARLERDRAVARAQAAEETLGDVDPEELAAGATLRSTRGGPATMTGTLGATAAPAPAAQASKPAARAAARGASLPPAPATNPFAAVAFEAAPVAAYVLAATFTGAARSVSCVALHPTKPMAAAGCDDASWSLMAMPRGERILAGEGHTDWVAGVAFSPAGGQLASAGGDGAVKLWDLAARRCVATLSDHAGPVWAVDFHHAGGFLASGSMDGSARLWDVAAGRCRLALRGHADSVNGVAWQPFANAVATASSDKTLSLWDARTGLCTQSLYGHSNSVNALAWALRGDTLASCDADGDVKLWDVRMAAELLTVRLGPHPANKVALDRSGRVLAVASDDGKVKCVATADGTLIAELVGHADAVHAVAFDPAGEFLLSAGADTTVRMWAPPPAEAEAEAEAEA